MSKKYNKHIKRTKEQQELDIKLLGEGKKWCPVCGNVKELVSFNKNKTRPDGCSPYCRYCNKAKYYTPYLEKHLYNTKQWQKNHPERTRDIDRKTKSRPASKIRRNLTKRIKKYLNSSETKNIHRSLINCCPIDLVKHLESKFDPNMSWANYGIYWQIDHIIPCVAFDFNKKQHILWCWDYRNLRPLEGIENAKKRDIMPDGRIASDLKEHHPDLLHKSLSEALESLGIANITEYMASISS